MCAEAVTAQCFHVHSLHPCPAHGEFGPDDLAGAVQCQHRGCWLLVQLPDVSAAAAPPAASSSPSSLRLLQPSGSSLGCWLSITSALHSAGAWLQGFTPHFRPGFPAASRRVWGLIDAFPDICAVRGDTGPLLEHPFHIPS